MLKRRSVLRNRLHYRVFGRVRALTVAFLQLQRSDSFSNANDAFRYARGKRSVSAARARGGFTVPGKYDIMCNHAGTAARTTHGFIYMVYCTRTYRVLV